MSFRTALLAATALLATANSHIIMANPVPYSNDKIDNSPITKAQFPCKAQNGFTVTKMNSIKVGEQQTVSFKGTAVHGGGSCQLSYTQDTEPTANSKFKVIKSIEGGCPGLDGSTKEFKYTLPDSIPNGKGTFAWTWNSKMAGQPELYMNCAPIDVTGGASDASKLDSLPDTLFANVGVNSCKQVENKAIKFPNPGKEVEDGGQGDAVAPTGECGSSSGGSDSSPAPGGASSAPASKPTPPSGQPASPSAPASQPTPTGGAGGAPAPRPSNTGGIFAPGASSAAGAVPTTLATAVAPSAPAGTASPPTSTGTPSSGAPSTGAPSSGAPSTGAPSTDAPAAGGAAGSCSTDGAIVCNGTTQFGICNKGSVTWQAVAAGTQCANGVIAKRAYYGRIARPRV